MSQVNFNYNGIDITIQCKSGDKMKDICQKFCTKVQININSVCFLYGGKQVKNNLTFEQSLNTFDKARNVMNILVPSLDNKEKNNSSFNIESSSDSTSAIKNISSTSNIPKSILTYRRVDLINDFVERLYNKILGRLSEPGGKAFWTDIFIKRKKNNIDVIKDFYHSQEFIARNLTDEEYIRTLYNSILGRDPDHDGFNFWVNELKNSKSRDWVLACFVNSEEFKEMVIYYI